MAGAFCEDLPIKNQGLKAASSLLATDTRGLTLMNLPPCDTPRLNTLNLSRRSRRVRRNSHPLELDLVVGLHQVGIHPDLLGISVNVKIPVVVGTGDELVDAHNEIPKVACNALIVVVAEVVDRELEGIRVLIGLLLNESGFDQLTGCEFGRQVYSLGRQDVVNGKGAVYVDLS
jgi:hypothetical protein